MKARFKRLVWTFSFQILGRGCAIWRLASPTAYPQLLCSLPWCLPFLLIRDVGPVARDHKCMQESGAGRKALGQSELAANFVSSFFLFNFQSVAVNTAER
ncbi:hypothetical protein K456DRAFT_1037489 [Colletotrichum gloeosporioides 23]|nr:hypothetical protein K456DRAFT_1037489 [Colletotrichum gloeosporioides 23]